MEKELVRQKEIKRLLGEVFDCRIAAYSSQLSVIFAKNALSCPSRSVLRPIGLNSPLLPLAENDKLKGLPYCMKDVNR